ncbi:vacuolar protein sorting-associated protein 52 homolog isoform X1 [Oreochromis niloticus]|uniref:Vacuolar protein sorting-associated protein 52 homolog n=1 Tax=Pundamilia nyererei TaxID=303518 RepID=A0A9Y3RV97_9CICH|nr:PREDICTED: vacuolar protein sorting-associated protein 52 homolog isoform X1 [Pundamilia nyererei]XP_013123062.2 vacuolar protein sorting-associated protein 52 homolog isoform X1 [Oreochromis niloticus]XP_024654112.1 vacuolar protein sorting-associated protein 52 homolog [Maylandia zebra]XP_024654113.1 vacuolar protein sorting-associated protein 52 homolog [Maylandia zebra]XP_026013057.1 vacuolar protein sorting-associated protein 52 homolog isoform X1 [Astatotilapia calliptera]
MAEGTATAAGAGPDVNTAGNPTEVAMAYLQDEKTEADIANLNLGELDITTDEFILDEVDIHIQANLEDDLVKEALKTGVDLRQYSKQVEAELQRIEQASIKDYIKESQNIALLHNQITACDSILERMEGMLSGFQSDLSSISSEIQTLQQQSVSMNVRLKNRQAVRSHLSQLVDELVVPGAMISTILDSPVTEQEFLEQLHELNTKINFAKELSFRETLACSDIQDIVDRLKLKAVSKIREFILQKIYSFRKPMTNYQIPQNTLLKYRFFYQFLLANERTVAKEIRDEYVDTMSKIYYSYFKSYSGRLLKVQYEEVADKDDLMGVEDTAKKGFFSKPSLKSRNTIFTLGQRGAILSPAELEGPILVPHTAQRGDSRYPYETLFRSQHYALLDNGCREYLFLSDFFMVAGNSALDLFNSIMGKTLSMFLKSMSTYVSDCYDSIAVFLCIHIILRFRAITAKRNIPALDKYWEAVLELLWPRFELILEMNISSIRNTDPQKLGVLDTRPHYITRRYAEFSSAIVSINQTFPNERTNALLGQLQIEVENFVLKMAAEFPSRRDQLIFLINNYDMMLSVLMERAADDSKEVEGFQQLLLARTQEFIEEILSPPFGGMIAFVKEAEALMEKGQLDRLKNDEARITQLVRGFSSTWKQSVEAMSQDVMRSFTNFKNGTSIIQGALTQLIQYYHGFHKVLNQPTFRSLAVRSELINLHHLMVEVKKHKPNF